jgi:type IV secretion system protein VirB9
MIAKCITSLALLTLLTGEATARNNPTAHPNDARIKRVVYQENNVIPLHGMAFTTTQVLFGKNEVVLDVEGGDTAAWMVTQHAHLPNMVFIKPTVLGSNSIMTIITNKHQYYFHVMGDAELSKDVSRQTYAITFSYPDEEAAQKKAAAASKTPKAPKKSVNPVTNPEAYNWNYRFSGSAQLTPVHVFDDGTFTWFELAKNQAVPAVFAVDDSQGKESLVNTRREGNYLVVQRTAPQFTLRSGGIVTSVFNINEIQRIKQNRRPS